MHLRTTQRRNRDGSVVRYVLGDRKFTTAVERVIFAMVANRAIDPMSKLANRRVGHP